MPNQRGAQKGATPDKVIAGTPLAPDRAVRRLTALGIALALVMLILGAAILFDARQDAWRQAESTIRNLTVALEREVSRNIAVYDLSLQGAMDAIRDPGINSVTPTIRQSAIFDRAASAEYLGSLLVLNENGDIIADSTSIVPHKLDLRDRDYFMVHQQRPDAGLFVSMPFRSRLRGGDPSVAISRRIDKADGSFGGIVVGTMRLAYLHDMFSGLNVGPGGSVSLVHTGGRLLARVPYVEQEFGMDMSRSEVLRRFTDARSGLFMGDSSIDGVNRLLSYTQIGNLPLVLVVASATDDILREWRQKAVAIGSILLLLCGATIALSLLFRREMLRRMAAETALLEAANKLTLVAATDGLTGLANRRAFEEGMQHEWKRAGRSFTPVALLMIDADHFKAFNDRYGHQAGNSVLRQIARSLQDNTRRPADLAARYGGEEFVVLLPETDLVGAQAIAERILEAVRALQIPHEDSPSHHVTVSIGLAVADSVLDLAEATLLKQADAALYAAKRSGRNRIGVAETPVRVGFVMPTLHPSAARPA